MSAGVPNGTVAPQAGVRGRIFLVGCPRSGTTLLQSLLAAHPQVTSFPESHYFWSLVPHDPEARAAGVALPQCQQRFRAYAEQLGRPEMAQRFGAQTHLMSTCIEAYVGMLDDLTLEKQKVMWVDKTPENLHYVDVIERYIPGVCFVHVVRHGPDVVASLYEVTRQYAERWHGPWSLDACVDRWNKDIGITLGLMGRENHILVRFENLVAQPEDVLTDLCALLGICYDQAMIEQSGQVARALIRTDELWKVGATKPISKPDSSKFDSLFSEEQKAAVRGRLVEIDGLEWQDRLRAVVPVTANRE